MKLGLHISTSGNLNTTPERARAMGAEAIQIFAANPRGWKPTLYTKEQGAAFISAAREAAIDPVWIHMIYLVSYGTENDEQREKSITAMTTMLQTADTLGAKGVVTHMGSHKGAGFDQATSRLTDSYTRILEAVGSSLLALENSAGAGGNIGNSLEELSTMIEVMKQHPRLAVCIDTAHAFTSGYDLRTETGVNDFVERFDKLIGIKRLVVMHLNDSKADLDTHIDRHENIGDGYIGLDGFSAIINHPKLAHVTGLLEVPGLNDDGPDKANLDRLKSLRRDS